MKKILTTLLLLGLCLTSTWARDREREERRVPLPPPSSFMDQDSVSLSVLRIRPNQPGTVTFMESCWAELKKEARLKVDPLMVAVYLSLKDRDPLNQILPLQCVRTERVAGKGVQPTMAVTLSGFRGLQRLFYKNLLAGPDGKAFPIKEVGAGEIALAPGWDEPGRARILARHEESFYMLHSMDQAQKVLDTYEYTPVAQYAGYDSGKAGLRGFVRLAQAPSLDLRSHPFLSPLQSCSAESLASIPEASWSGELDGTGHHFSVTTRLKSTRPEVKAALVAAGLSVKEEKGELTWISSIPTRLVARYFLGVRGNEQAPGGPKA